MAATAKRETITVKGEAYVLAITKKQKRDLVPIFYGLRVKKIKFATRKGTGGYRVYIRQADIKKLN